MAAARALGLAEWSALLVALGTAGAPAAARAADTCVHSAADNGWTFVLEKLKPKPGKSGALSGYVVSDSDTTIEPISGGWLVDPSVLYLGITRYATGVTPTGTPTTAAETAYHQMNVPLDGGVGKDYLWTSTGGGTVESFLGDTQIVDCANVPKVPKVFAK